MEVPQILFRQTIVMFLYMMLGFTLYRTGKISRECSKGIAAMMLNMVVPAVIINSFCGVERSAQKWAELGASSLLAALALALALVVARALYPKAPIDDFAAAFSNAGFMGIPLVQAGLGPDAVFYLVGFLALLNILQWTYGVGLLTGKPGTVTPRAILLNPLMGGTAAGLILFATGLGTRLPEVISTTMKGVCGLNSPLAMIVLGVYLAQIDPKTLVTTPRLYGVTAVRLILTPLLTLALLWAIPVPREMKLALLIVASAPVGANVAVYAQLHDLDYAYACKSVVLSTVLSVVTVPLVIAAAELVF